MYTSDVIKQAMLAKQINQSDLADACGVTPQAVQQWISGKTAPKGKRLLLVSQLLNIPIAQLLANDDIKHERFIEGQVIREELPPAYQTDGGISPEEMTIIELYRRLTTEQKNTERAVLERYVCQNRAALQELAEIMGYKKQS